MEQVNVINRTMELSECASEWFFDEKYRCWCLEDVLYTEKATTPKFQRLSIFVPEPYMTKGGEINQQGTMNGYSAETVPVIFENNSAGYMQMPHVWLEGPRCYAQQYLERGFVYVSCGNRGRETRDADGRLCGKAPVNLVDLKTAIRFLRHNRAVLPGNFDRMISVGWSAGGAMSTLLAVTGNSADYLPLLEANGAFPDERDDVFAAQIYCPIIDLEHADSAYEWMFAADHENEDSPAGPSGVMTPFQEALSAALQKRYISYFNDLKLVDPQTKEVLFVGTDGRSGSGYDYLMRRLEDSATDYLRRLQSGMLDEKYSPAEYLAGEYEYQKEVPMGGPEKKDVADLLRGHAGPGVMPGKAEGDRAQGNTEAGQEKPSLGDLVSRPPKGVPFKGMKPPMMTVKGSEKSAWLSWDGERAHIRGLDTYVLQHRRRMKPCTSFDTLGMDSGENEVFGTNEQPFMHFNKEISEAVLELKDQFPEEFERYYASFAQVKDDAELKERIALLNPLNYIGTEKKTDAAEHYRIRVGACDADTSLSVSMTLALKLAQAGKDTDYALVWDKPHCEADYPGEVCDWIDRICK